LRSRVAVSGYRPIPLAGTQSAPWHDKMTPATVARFQGSWCRGAERPRSRTIKGAWPARVAVFRRRNWTAGTVRRRSGAMSLSGQNAKYSERADNFRFAPINGHHQARTPCRKSATTGLMHRSKLECSAAAWGPFKEFGLVANRSQPELFAGFITVPGAYRYRSGSLSGRSARCGAD
jgi:hypothetical protein